MSNLPPIEQTGPALNAVLGAVLGDLAFMVSDGDAPAPLAGTVWLQAETAYRGPVSGRLTCWCSRAFAVQLAANLLGLDPDAPTAQTDAEDALGEFLNVLCGNLVTMWYGTTAVFNVGIPRVRECLDGPELTASDPHDTCQLSVNDEPVYCLHTRGQ